MRSNRQLTQFAVDRVKGLLMGATDQSAAGNTTVERDDCDCCERPSHIVVRLFGEEIIRFYTSPLNNRIIVGALVSAGNFYDSKGRPSRTTRERLNGLLDFACRQNFFPEGIRVFIREDGDCCIGRGDTFRALNSSNPRCILVGHPTDLIMS